MREEYQQGWKINDVMPINNVGIVTSRDNFVFDFDKEQLKARITRFSDLSESNEIIKRTFLSEKDQLPVEKARKRIADNKGNLNQFFIKSLYRPFDFRHLFYHDAVIERSRRDTMQHMIAGENLGLISARSNKSQEQNQFFCSKYPIETKSGEATTQSALFPLYLYPTEKKSLFNDEPANGKRKPNLAPEFVKAFGEKLNLRFEANDDSRFTNDDSRFTPEDVFYYAYAVFHSPTYRARYAEFLKIDFPRLPLTSDVELFRALVNLGGELVGLHLLEREAAEIVGFPVGGENTVELVKYQNGKVFINKEQFFDGVPAEVWEFHIGGYRVAEKWLKDRKGRKLRFDDLLHYQKTIAALQRTIEVMSEIDEVIENKGGFPIR